MTGSTLLGCLAGIVLALDGLHFVQSRIAMLDVFLVLGTTAAFACLRRRPRPAAGPARRRRPRPRSRGWGPRLGLRPWRLAAGVCLGAALGDQVERAVLRRGARAARARLGGRRAPHRRHPRALPGHAAALGRCRSPSPSSSSRSRSTCCRGPGWFLSDLGYDRSWAVDQPTRFGFLPDALRSLWHYHQGMYDVPQRAVEPAPVPVAPRRVAAAGPPGLVLLPARADLRRRTAAPPSRAAARCWRSATRRCGGAPCRSCSRCCGCGPPSATGGPARCSRSCSPRSSRGCATTCASARCSCSTRCPRCRSWRWPPRWSAAGCSAARTRRRRAGAGGRGVVGVWLALVVVCFAFFYPVLAAQTIPLADWQDRMWLPSWV